MWEVAAADCADNFIERWNWIGSEEMDEDDNVPQIPPLAPPGKLQESRLSRVFRSPEARILWAGSVTNPVAGGADAAATEARPAAHPIPESVGRMKCQVVRSMGEWHNGVEEPDISHYEAWIKAINAAEHYIYVEQQCACPNPRKPSVPVRGWILGLI